MKRVWIIMIPEVQPAPNDTEPFAAFTDQKRAERFLAELPGLSYISCVNVFEENDDEE